MEVYLNKCHNATFYILDTHEKSVFELMTNLKFSFFESGPGSVHIPPKPIFYIGIYNRGIYNVDILSYPQYTM